MGRNRRLKRRRGGSQVEDANDDLIIVKTIDSPPQPDPGSSSSSDSEFEELLTPREFFLTNLNVDIKPRDVKDFFEKFGRVKEVNIHPEVCFHPRIGTMKKALFSFVSTVDVSVEDVLKSNGELLCDKPVSISASVNHLRKTFFISGYNKQLDLKSIEEQLNAHFEPCGTILKYFFPKKSGTENYLGCCYMLIDEDDDDGEDVLERNGRLLGDDYLVVRTASMKPSVMKAKMAFDTWISR